MFLINKRFLLLLTLTLFITSYTCYAQKYKSLNDDYNIVKKELLNYNIDNEFEIERVSNQIVRSKYELENSNQTLKLSSKTQLYFSKIIAELLGEKYKLINNLVQLNVLKSEDKNAFVLLDGSIYITTTLISHLPNEVAFKFIIGHELAHFINKDIGQTLYEEYNEHAKLPYYKKRQTLVNLSKDRELRCDSLSTVLIKNITTKDVESIVSSMDLLKESNDLSILRSGKSKEQLEFESIQNKIQDDYWGSHPGTNKRQQILAKTKVTASTPIKTSSDQFNYLVEKSKSVKHLFLAKLYHKCLLEAFLQFVSEENQKESIYYILESIRRLEFLNQNIGIKPFLLETAKANINFEKGIYKNLKYITTNKNLISLIKHKNILVKDTIVTYNDAFSYFANQAHLNNISESLFSIGLHYNDSSLLKEYANLNKEYSNFTLNYLNQTLAITHDSTIKIIAPIREYSKNKQGKIIYHFSNSIINSKHHITAFKKINNLNKYDVYYSEDITNNYLKDLLEDFNSIEKLLKINEGDNSIPINFLLFSPEVWVRMNELNISKIKIIEIRRDEELNRPKKYQYTTFLSSLNLATFKFKSESFHQYKWKKNKPEYLNNELIKILNN